MIVAFGICNLLCPVAGAACCAPLHPGQAKWRTCTCSNLPVSAACSKCTVGGRQVVKKSKHFYQGVFNHSSISLVNRKIK